MKYKELLIKLGEQTEDKINQIRSLQRQISDLMKQVPEEELEKIKQEPEIQALDKKLNRLMNELW